MALIRGDLLRRADTDPSLPDSAVLRQLNMARREIWGDLVGSDAGPPVYVDLVSGQATYPLDVYTPEQVVGVSVVDADGLYPRRLAPLSVATMLARYPFYPRSDGLLTPQTYQLRLWASVAPVSEIWADPFLLGNEAQNHGWALNLWPAPNIDLQAGIVVTMVGAAAPLTTSGAASDSALPAEVDEAACYQAAVKLSPRLGYDPVAMQWLPVLRQDARDTLMRARRWRANRNGPMTRLAPQGFGPRVTGRRVEPDFTLGAASVATPTTPTVPPTPTPVTVSAAFAHVDVVPVVGASSVTVNLDGVGAARVPDGLFDEVRAVSQNQGEIFSAQADNVYTLTATLRAGFTFDADDVVRFVYPIAS